jgi:hypothetical protein
MLVVGRCVVDLFEHFDNFIFCGGGVEGNRSLLGLWAGFYRLDPLYFTDFRLDRMNAVHAADVGNGVSYGFHVFLLRLEFDVDKMHGFSLLEYHVLNLIGCFKHVGDFFQDALAFRWVIAADRGDQAGVQVPVQNLSADFV